MADSAQFGQVYVGRSVLGSRSQLPRVSFGAGESKVASMWAFNANAWSGVTSMTA